MNKKLKCFEMFAGYGGAAFSLKRANVNFETIGFSEIDKFAIQCYNQNHPGIKNYGDATKIDANKLPNFDVLFGGFPCQAFSIAGNRKGMEETRGTLIYDILRIAREKKPTYLVLENVKGLLNHDNGNTFKTIVNAIKSVGYGVIWDVLNSKDYGTPQNRERVFFICKLGGWDFMEFNFPNKKTLDVGIYDLLDDVVDKKYYLTDNNIKSLLNALKRRERKIEGSISIKKEFINCLTTGSPKRALHDTTIIVINRQPRTGDPKKGGTGLLYKNDGTIYCLDTQKSNIILYQKDLRTLTPIECFRFMGFKDGEINIDNLSDIQLYKLAGNGWDVNLVSLILRKLFKDYII